MNGWWVTVGQTLLQAEGWWGAPFHTLAKIQRSVGRRRLLGAAGKIMLWLDRKVVCWSWRNEREAEDERVMDYITLKKKLSLSLKYPQIFLCMF